jgi:hypothetical protein
LDWSCVLLTGYDAAVCCYVLLRLLTVNQYGEYHCNRMACFCTVCVKVCFVELSMFCDCHSPVEWQTLRYREFAARFVLTSRYWLLGLIKCSTAFSHDAMNMTPTCE